MSGSIAPAAEGPNFRSIKPTLQAHDLVLANTYFDAGATYYGISSKVMKRIDYLVCPRSMVQNIEECFVSMNKGRRLQHIRCAAPKDHFPIYTTFWHTFEYKAKTKTLSYNKEACNAVLLYGTGRPQFVAKVEERLAQHRNKFEEWEYEGDVDQLNAGIMQIIQEVSAEHLNEVPGYVEKREDTLAESTKPKDLLMRRRKAKSYEVENS